MSDFSEYLEHGWRLVPILAGQKGPRKREWNKRENCINDPHVELRSAGLAHAYSGTCSIDVDDYDYSREWLAERGVDLDALFMAPDSVQIQSGRANHGKLLYALPEALASKQIIVDKKCRLDFRCATAGGLTVQDVLPPSIHPDTGMPYKWAYGDDMFGDWRELPEIPAELHKIWVDMLGEVYEPQEMPEKGASLDELRALLAQQDPDMGRDDWVRVGMAIHHETDGGQDGLDLWDEWSATSPKYVSRRDLETCWRSFHDTPNAVTIGVLRQSAVATVSDFTAVEAPAPEDDPWAQQKEQNRARFSLTHVSEIARREPVQWLVEQLVPQAELGMIYGPSGAGKSFAALDLAFAVSNGFTWFNRATKIGSVVWIAAEAAGSMRNRAKAYAQARGVELSKSDLWIMEQSLSLMNDEDAEGLMHCVTEKEPSLIIVDTLAAASGGANENSGEDMNKVLENCRKLHEVTGAMVMLVHHTGKDTTRGARGWSGLKAAMDVELSVYSQEGNPLRIMETTKQRDIMDGEKFPFKLQVVPLDMDGMDSCVIDALDQSVLADVIGGGVQLKGNQRLVFDAVYTLVAQTPNEAGPAKIQDVYDEVVVRMPPPPNGGRDRRAESARRALQALHESGRVTILEDNVVIGSSIND